MQRGVYCITDKGCHAKHRAELGRSPDGFLTGAMAAFSRQFPRLSALFSSSSSGGYRDADRQRHRRGLGSASGTRAVG